jgi:hypothetical protein
MRHQGKTPIKDEGRKAASAGELQILGVTHVFIGSGQLGCAEKKSHAQGVAEIFFSSHLKHFSSKTEVLLSRLRWAL